MIVEPLRHGYTNSSFTDGQVVVKTYLGPDSSERQAREELALRRLEGRLPVPAVIASRPGQLTTTFAAGVPAQEAIEGGSASEVLYACGRLLVELQSVDPRQVFEDCGQSVLVHNDFGPNNIVMHPNLAYARLLCDWEWVTAGARITDLAWAEFIVRLHHPESVHALAALFEGYGEKPVWELRQAAMSERATVHSDFVQRWHGRRQATVWSDRIAAIASWRET